MDAQSVLCQVRNESLCKGLNKGEKMAGACRTKEVQSAYNTWASILRKTKSPATGRNELENTI